MTHEQAQELLLDLAYRELEPATAAEVARHAGECATCGPQLQRLTSTRALASALRESAPPRSNRDQLVEAARRAVRARPERRWFARPATLSFGAAAAVALVAFGVTLQLTRPGAHRASDEESAAVSRAAAPALEPRSESAAPAPASSPDLPEAPPALQTAPAAPAPRARPPRPLAPAVEPPRATAAAEPPTAMAAPSSSAAAPEARREASAGPSAAAALPAMPLVDAQRSNAAPTRVRGAAKARASAEDTTSRSGPRAGANLPETASFTAAGFLYRARKERADSGLVLVIEKLRAGDDPGVVASWRADELRGGDALVEASAGDDLRDLRWSDGVLRFTFQRAVGSLACSVSGVESGAPAVTCRASSP
ncbi:MAG TPA: hypothetical protein VFE30_11555 [Anaeromyxobacteraceae bacterium]|jgi:hypothetical protein|nr:hypothetical protein [Anaeromyxobacteraceae bacterium]